MITLSLIDSGRLRKPELVCVLFFFFEIQEWLNLIFIIKKRYSKDVLKI